MPGDRKGNNLYYKFQTFILGVFYIFLFQDFLSVYICQCCENIMKTSPALLRTGQKWLHTSLLSLKWSFTFKRALQQQGMLEKCKIFKMTATVFQSGNLQGNINLKINEVISYADGDFCPALPNSIAELFRGEF